MAKEDCEQFKYGYTDYTGYEDLSEEEKDDRWYEISDKNLHWSYSKYTPESPKPKLTEGEIEMQKILREKRLQEAEERRKNIKPITIEDLNIIVD